MNSAYFSLPYRVLCDRILVGNFKTLKEAKAFAEGWSIADVNKYYVVVDREGNEV